MTVPDDLETKYKMWFDSTQENDDYLREKYENVFWEEMMRPASLGAILLYD
jgi:hypothetical protein